MKRIKTPRHAKFAKRLAGILFWRRLATESYDALSTNWIVPANDNEIDSQDNSTDCLFEIRPTPNELIAAYELGGIEYDEPYQAPSPLTGTIARKLRIGGLTFATVSNVPETPLGSIVSWTSTAGKIGREPVERFGQPRGGNQSERISRTTKATNNFFAAMLGAAPHRYIPGKAARSAKRWPPFELPKELRGETPLNEARTWAGLPPVEKDQRPALPCGTRNAADSFIGHHITRQVHQRIVMDNSPGDRSLKVERDKMTVGAMTPRDTKALNHIAHESCKSFAELGAVFGYTGKTAERAGKRIALSASDNLAAAINIIAA